MGKHRGMSCLEAVVCWLLGSAILVMLAFVLENIHKRLDALETATTTESAP